MEEAMRYIGDLPTVYPASCPKSVWDWLQSGWRDRWMDIDEKATKRKLGTQNRSSLEFRRTQDVQIHDKVQNI